jgi:hypothetical protein
MRDSNDLSRKDVVRKYAAYASIIIARVAYVLRCDLDQDNFGNEAASLCRVDRISACRVLK